MKRLFQLLFLLAASVGLRAPAATYTFNNSPSGDITFAGTGSDRRSSVFPSSVTASGIPAGTVTSVKVTLNGLNVARPDDMEMVLVSPSGAKLVFWSDNGTATTPLVGATVTLDDAAATLLPDATAVSSGSSYQPSCVDSLSNIATVFATAGVSISSPGDCATPRGTATFTTKFAGAFTTAVSGSVNNPNGTWQLYTIDDVAGTDTVAAGGTSRFSGWTLTIVADATTFATTTTVTSSQASSATGSSVTFTATVLKQTDSSAVTSGTVTFTEGATTLASGVALNGSGQATYTTSSLTEGDHTIVATYSPGSGFLASNNSVTQRVDNTTTQTGNSFANTGAMSIVSVGTGTTVAYPSRVVVSGLSGTISKVTLTLSGLTHGKLDDLEVLLVAPGGQTFVPLGDAGGTTSGVSGINLTFDDAAASLISDTAAPASGTYRPSSYNNSDDGGSAPTGGSSIPPPSGPYPRAASQGSSTFANVFNGSNPNGTWSLYLYDDVTGDGTTSVSGGWSLNFVTTSDAATATTVTSSLNPSLVGSNVTFTASVVTSPGGVPVTSGTVTFREGGTTLAGPVTLNGSGQASFSTTALTEGNHLITADYQGSPGNFNLSTSSAYDQRVDAATTVTGANAAGGKFCNPGTLSISASSPSTASVYPSHINVSSIAGTITELVVHLDGISVSTPDDLEFLLVGPTGANLVLVSDVGGTASSLSGVNLVLRDSGSSLLPDASVFASGTYKPTSAATGISSFPSPAPSSGSLAHPAGRGSATLASQFNGTSPNGTWALYAMDDVGGGGATVSGGWCLTITVNAAPVAAADTIVRDKNRSVKVPIATLLGNDSDPNGTTPTFVDVDALSANGAAVRVVGSWIAYEAVPGSNTDDTFTYTITDGTSNTDGTVTVTVERPEAQTANLSIAAAGGSATLTVAGIPGRTYQFQYTTSLTSPISWTALGGPQVADAAGRASSVDSSGLTRFYRAIEP